MGLQDKVALLLVAAILHTACTICKPQSLRENPFYRYVGKHVNSKVNPNSIPNYNTLGEAYINPSIHKVLNYPHVNYPLDACDKTPNVFNSRTNAIHKSRNIKYDLALLESFKKEARRKRKSKKQVNENIASSKPILLPDSQTSYVTDIGTFPEVEYPLSAMDTWVPKYWNPLAFGADESSTFQTQPLKPSKYNPFIKYSNSKRNKGLISFKKSKENRNTEVKTPNHTSEMNSKTVVLPVSETKANDNNLKDTIYLLQSNLRRKPKKRIMTKSTKQNLTEDRKVLPKILTSNQPSKQSDTVLTFTSSNLDNGTLTCSQEKVNNDVTICTTKTSNKSVDSNNMGTADDDTNIDNDDQIVENLILSKLLSNNNQLNNFDSLPQTKLVSGECPSDVICNLQIQNNVSTLYDTVSSNDTHESLIDPKAFDELQIPDNLQPEHNSTDVVRLTNYRITSQANSQLKINNENTMLPIDKLQPYNVSMNESSALQTEKLRDLAENVMAQVGAVPKEYNLPTEFVLEQLDASDLPADYNCSLDVTLSPYNHNRIDSHRIQSDLTNFYNMVENALAQIGLQQEKIHISNDFISEIISGIDSLPTEYIVPDSPTLYEISDPTEDKPTEYILPDPIGLDYSSIINEQLRQMKYINYNKTSEQYDLLSVKSSEQVILTNDSVNDSHPVCPLPEIDQCFISYLPESDLFQNNTSTTPLMEILNGSTFERIREYSENLIKEKDNPNELIDDFKEKHSDNKTSQDGQMSILIDMPVTVIIQNGIPRTNHYSKFDMLTNGMLLPGRHNTKHTQPSCDVEVQAESFKGMPTTCGIDVVPESFGADKTLVSTDSDIILKSQEALEIDGLSALCNSDLLPETLLSDTDNQVELLDANNSLIPPVSNNSLREVSSKVFESIKAIDLFTIEKTNDYMYDAENSQQSQSNKANPVMIATDNILGSPEAYLFLETLAIDPITIVQQETFALDESASNGADIFPEAKTTKGIPAITDAINIPNSRVIDRTRLSPNTNVLSKALVTYEDFPATLGGNVSIRVEPIASANLLVSPDTVISLETTTTHDFPVILEFDIEKDLPFNEKTQDYINVLENLTQIKTKLLSDKVLSDMITTDNILVKSNADLFPETPASNVKASSFNTDVQPETLFNNGKSLSRCADVSSKLMGSIEDKPAITDTSTITQTRITDNSPPSPDTEVFSEALANNDLPVTAGEQVLIKPLDSDNLIVSSDAVISPGTITTHDIPVIHESAIETDLPFTYKTQNYIDVPENPAHTLSELLFCEILPEMIASDNISASSEADLFPDILATDAIVAFPSTDTQPEIPDVKNKSPSNDADNALEAIVTEDKRTLSDAYILAKKCDTINTTSSLDTNVFPGALATDDLPATSDVNVILKPLSTDNLLVSCDVYIMPETVTTDNIPVIPESDIETNLPFTDNSHNYLYMSVPINPPQTQILSDEILPDIIISVTDNMSLSLEKTVTTDNIPVIPESDIETNLPFTDNSQNYLYMSVGINPPQTQILSDEILPDIIISVTDNMSLSLETELFPETLTTNAITALSDTNVQPETLDNNDKSLSHNTDIFRETIATDSITAITDAIIIPKSRVTDRTPLSPVTGIFSEELDTDGLTTISGEYVLQDPLDIDNLLVLPDADNLPETSSISHDIPVIPESDIKTGLHFANTTQKYINISENHPYTLTKPLSEEILTDMIASDNITASPETLLVTLATDVLAAFSNNDTQPEMSEVKNKLPPRDIDIVPTDNEDISTISEAYILTKKPISNNTSPSPETNVFPEPLPINILSATPGANILPEPLATDNLQLLSDAAVLPHTTISDDILLSGSDTLTYLPTTDTNIDIQNYTTYVPENVSQAQLPVLSEEVLPEIIASNHIPVPSETEFHNTTG